MPGGHFLGGFAEGGQARDKIDNARNESAANLALEARRVKLAESNAAAENGRANLVAVDKSVNDIWTLAEKTAGAYRDAGKSPTEIAQGIAPLLQHAVDLYSVTGRDPSLIIEKGKTIAGLPAAPNTDIAKLEADRRAGYIDQATYDAKVKALTTPSGTTVNVNNAGESAFAKSLGEEFGKDVVKRRTDAVTAAAALESTAQARNLLDQGVISGAGADWMLNAGKAFQAIGINLAPDAIANTEALGATTAKQVGNIIRMFGAGTGLSDSDKEFAMQAAGGKITMTEQSMRRIFDVNDRASRNVVRAYNAEVQQYGDIIGGKGLMVPEPPEPTKPVRSKNVKGKTWYEWPDGEWYDEPPGGQ